ncbi:MAG TPA: LIM domain-containing protein [Nocardioides sp.]|uniref:LIM domain-containing protein n=1 Tax=Nocardioides sp. TaxID=35761 RepID=UPI002B85B2A0|nr:LIM domain-containing protein [Nocardioides sp.]HTW16168.1 LIM domain-containing protein [Nocardioides sp.]
MTMLTCEGCGEPIQGDDSHLDFNGEDWHEGCFEVSGGPTYCCGMIYENGEDTCFSCGEPLL